MTRAYNFSAGPAALPTEVLEIAQKELLDFKGTGMSVMEMSHRSSEYVQVATEAVQDLRDLMNISDDYEVLFLQGGATGQFSAIPMNLMHTGKADYIHTGAWAKKAIAEAKKYGEVNIAGSSEDKNFSYAPAQEDLSLGADASYIHYTPNETIGGVEYDYIPTNGDIPVVADFSSSILGHEIDVSKYGLIYAGAQKNIGPSGVCWVIVRKDLMGKAIPTTPSVFDYQKNADAESMLNTPPTLAVYLCGQVFKWMKRQGGVKALQEINERKSGKLYDFIDASGFYANPVAVNNRSRTNVPFTLANAELDKVFLAEAAEANLLTLKGHRSVGGMRASIYNAVSEEAVDALINFMADFEKRNG